MHLTLEWWPSRITSRHQQADENSIKNKPNDRTSPPFL